MKCNDSAVKDLVLNEGNGVWLQYRSLSAFEESSLKGG